MVVGVIGWVERKKNEFPRISVFEREREREELMLQNAGGGEGGEKRFEIKRGKGKQEGYVEVCLCVLSGRRIAHQGGGGRNSTKECQKSRAGVRDAHKKREGVFDK